MTTSWLIIVIFGSKLSCPGGSGFGGQGYPGLDVMCRLHITVLNEFNNFNIVIEVKEQMLKALD